MPKVVATLRRIEAVQEWFERGPKHLDGADGAGAQQRFQLGECHFDRIEIGAVGRQESKRRAGRLDRLAHAGDLVRAEIVQDHQIARPQGRHQDLLDERQERGAIDRAVEHAGRADAITAQGRDDGGGLPVMGWTPPDGINVPGWCCREPPREASVQEVATVGLDLAKHVFQAHGASAAGTVLFRRKLRREKVLPFFTELPRCRVAMEACAGAHHWARAIGELGHEVCLIPPAYVKPFVKRQKNDMADAEAICEAAQRPTMRLVAVKSEAKQAAAVIFRTRDVLVGQRTQIINALRGHLGEYGLIAPQGPSHVDRLIAQVEDPASAVPEAARCCLARLVDVLRHLQVEIGALDKEIAARAKADEVARRLMTVPGIGPLIATAIEALAPPVEAFRSGRDFAAWIGLTPIQRSTGGKERLGRTSRMGERTLRRLLIFAASAVVRWAKRKGAAPGSWLARMLARKPPMVVIVALANKNARIAWALLARGGVYRAPAVAA